MMLSFLRVVVVAHANIGEYSITWQAVNYSPQDVQITCSFRPHLYAYVSLISDQC